MKEHNPLNLIPLLSAIIIFALGFVYQNILGALGLFPFLYGLIAYFGFEKIIPCPQCHKQDKVKHASFIHSEACGNEEQIESLMKQSGDLWCKRCSIRFGYEQQSDAKVSKP